MDERQDPAIGKKKLRRQILALRDEMPLTVREEKDRKILQTLIGEKLYKETKTILAYVEYRSEVATTPLLKKALTEGKQVFVPRVEGADMEFYRISDMEDLTEGYKGIREPVSGQAFFDGADRLYAAGETVIPLMLIPGAVFDRERHRIGYGKGFYDRYLKRLSETGINVHTLALCYECQILSEIPYEEHDIRPDMILTENRFYR